MPHAEPAILAFARSAKPMTGTVILSMDYEVDSLTVAPISCRITMNVPM